MLEGLKPIADRRNRCKISVILSSLDQEDAELLRGFLADTDRWSANGLANALLSRGVKVSVGVIIRHRNGDCSC